MRQIIVLIALATPVLIGEGGSGASIEGTVTDQRSKPISGAFVTVFRDLVTSSPDRRGHTARP